MLFVSLDEDQALGRLEASISGLADTHPELSARTLLSSGQRRVFLGLLILVVLGLIVSVTGTMIVVIALLTAVYLAVVINRVVIFVRSGDAGTTEVVSDDEARAVPDDQLPMYTVLIPAYREPGVIEDLLSHIETLEYPRQRLDVKLLLEADDDETIAAVRHLEDRGHIEVVLIPGRDPRTKPKALNYGLTLARGDLVTVFDAEDLPDPLQLRRAAVALGRLGPEVACLQAKLAYHNAEQNLLTKWFTIEYAMWFSLFLPGLVSMRAPLPLGGTSNHFRREALENLGAWDPYNVTEDADLGIRMYRRGWRIGVLESTTLEEANSDFINWIKQRSRWYKGYFQTYLIHMRNPRALLADLGWKSFLEFNLFVGGTPFLALVNPAFWTMAIIWFAVHPHIIRSIFPAPTYYAGVTCWIFGNFLVAYLTVLTCRLTKRVELLGAALLVPLYWVMMATAAIKAFWQLIFTPTFWEKTVHGLGHPDDATVTE